MRKYKNKFAFYLPVCILVGVFLNGCGHCGNVIKSEIVKDIPDRPYEKIIRLDTPESMPLEPDAGFVYVLPEGKISTDFPREIIVRNLDGLNRYERINRDNMQKYVIRDRRGDVRGYYEILPHYQAHVWEKGDGLMLQIILPQSKGLHKSGVDGGGPVPGVQ